MHWYALHVASCTEAIVSRKLMDAGIESYYPARLAKSKRKYRSEIQEKLFPGYVFARFNLLDKTPVVSVAQVIQILGTARSPEPIPDSEIAAVRLMVQYASASLASHPLATGETVTIQRGPLQSLNGRILHVQGKTRVAVSVTMLGRSLSVEVDAGDLAVTK